MQIFYLIRYVEKKNFVNENLYFIFEGQFLFDCRILVEFGKSVSLCFATYYSSAIYHLSYAERLGGLNNSLKKCALSQGKSESAESGNFSHKCLERNDSRTKKKCRIQTIYFRKSWQCIMYFQSLENFV